jgi:eukaryotic-like serine/threonine-protein kinase
LSRNFYKQAFTRQRLLLFRDIGMMRPLEYGFPIAMVSILVFSCFSSITTVACADSSGGDWPMFHHDPARTGFSRIAGPSLGATPLWNFTPARNYPIWSSPAIANGFVYFGDWDRNVYCISESTGNLIWNYSVPSLVSSSPAVANGYVYIGSDAVYDNGAFLNGTIYCLDAFNGTLVWSYNVGEADRSSPVVTNGYVYICSVGRYVGYLTQSIFCLNSSTGEHVWNFTISGPYGSTPTDESSPAVANGFVYFGSHDTNLYCLNASTGTKIWNYPTENPVLTTPAVANGYVYAASYGDSVYCFNASTGEKVWRYTIPELAYSSAAVANDRLYIGAGNDIYCLNAFSGEKVWNFTAAWTIYSSPALDNSRVYAGCWDGNVYCLNAANGSKLWSCQTGGGPQIASPVIANGRIYVASLGFYSFANETFGGTLYALAPFIGTIPEFPSWIILSVLAAIVTVTAAVILRKSENPRIDGFKQR